MFTPLEQVAEAYREWISSSSPRIPTGYPILDDRTGGGGCRGELLLFTARPSVGKTAWLLNVFEANRTRPMVMFSLEMSAMRVLNRLVAIHTKTDTREIDNGGAKVERLIKRTVQDFPMLSICDDSSLSLQGMGEYLSVAADTWGCRPELVAIDFLELIQGSGSKSQAEAVDQMGVQLKRFARTQDVFLVVLHQVGRGAGEQGHQPLSLTSGRYGGEMSADYVMAGYRPCLDPRLGRDDQEKLWPQIALQFLKTRGGPDIHPTGVIHHIDRGSMRITPPEYMEEVPLWR